MEEKPLVRWILVRSDLRQELTVSLNGAHRVAAVVYPNGVWHTFDQRGVGGENDLEETVDRAKVEAAASAIDQGFI